MTGSGEAWPESVSLKPDSMYFVKTNWFLRRLYPSGCIWHFSRKEPVIYLSFDDGPHPEATAFVLDELRRYGARASFFCIGKNVDAHPELYRRMLDEGHTVGNHTQHHLNGWKTPDKDYINDVREAARRIESRLFRPPYGRITRFQARVLTARENVHQSTRFRIIMWDVLSGDFDYKNSGEQCASNVTRHAGNGSIVVFHDSEKALPRLRYALPETLKFFTEKGFKFEAIAPVKD